MAKVTQVSTKKIFVYNVPMKNTNEDIKTHLIGHGVQVHEVKQRSHHDARRKSFVVTVAEKDSAKVFNECMWPGPIKMREYN